MESFMPPQIRAKASWTNAQSGSKLMHFLACFFLDTPFLTGVLAVLTSG
jgi:hypothetical protein